LLRDGHILYVQNEPISRPDLADDNNPNGLAAARRIYNSFLTTIQLLLDQIEFGRGDWAYLLRDQDGSYRLVYRKKPLIMSKFVWAPFIDENEVRCQSTQKQISINQGFLMGAQIKITRWDISQNREGAHFRLCQ